jgi:cell division protein FtsB
MLSLGPDFSSHSTVSSNERLQKAIERNRAKQLKKAQRGGRPIELSRQNSSVDYTDDRKVWSLPSNPPPPREHIDGVRVERNAPRRAYSTGDDISFTTERKELSRPVSRITYRAATENQKNKKTFSQKMIILAWAVCFIFILRLVFADRGVTDYYRYQKNFQQKKEEYQRAEMENRELAKEIELIKNDGKFQRKLVREHLGYIADDEYLVLFAKE